MTPWLTVRRAETPLVLAVPHAGTWIPDELLPGFRSPWLARKDADWHVDQLYDGLADATVVATTVSRSVIDMNRDPSGASLYPGQATTELCPTTTFDGEPLRASAPPEGAEIARRRELFFVPYHAALAAEVARLRATHPRVVVYDCHSIRSVVPRLFEGELPLFNVGTNGGTACARELRDAVAAACAASGGSVAVDGRFRGGWTTRHHGVPADGVHAIQMELSIRGYLREPVGAVWTGDWPPLWDSSFAAPMRRTLSSVLDACLEFAR